MTPGFTEAREMVRQRWIAVMACAMWTLLSCTKPCGPARETQYVKTPMPNEEAELMALYLSDEILAPSALYERIERELRTIREDTVAEYAGKLNMEYYPRFGQASYLYFTVDDTTYRQIISGNYHAWDSLHNVHHMIDFIAYKSRYESHYCTEIYFEGRRHPEVLAKAYSRLPGFLEHRETYFYVGFSNIYPRLSMDTLSYLFHGCTTYFPFGCDIDEFWYFVCTPDGTAYVGHWLSEFGNLDYPEWWVEAGKNWYDFWQGPYLGRVAE